MSVQSSLSTTVTSPVIESIDTINGEIEINFFKNKYVSRQTSLTSTIMKRSSMDEETTSSSALLGAWRQKRLERRQQSIEFENGAATIMTTTNQNTPADDSTQPVVDGDVSLPPSALTGSKGRGVSWSEKLDVCTIPARKNTKKSKRKSTRRKSLKTCDSTPNAEKEAVSQVPSAVPPLTARKPARISPAPTPTTQHATRATPAGNSQPDANKKSPGISSPSPRLPPPHSPHSSISSPTALALPSPALTPTDLYRQSVQKLRSDLKTEHTPDHTLVPSIPSTPTIHAGSPHSGGAVTSAGTGSVNETFQLGEPLFRVDTNRYAAGKDATSTQQQGLALLQAAITAQPKRSSLERGSPHTAHSQSPSIADFSGLSASFFRARSTDSNGTPLSVSSAGSRVSSLSTADGIDGDVCPSPSPSSFALSPAVGRQNTILATQFQTRAGVHSAMRRRAMAAGSIEAAAGEGCSITNSPATPITKRMTPPPHGPFHSPSASAPHVSLGAIDLSPLSPSSRVLGRPPPSPVLPSATGSLRLTSPIASPIQRPIKMRSSSEPINTPNDAIQPMPPTALQSTQSHSESYAAQLSHATEHANHICNVDLARAEWRNITAAGATHTTVGHHSRTTSRSWNMNGVESISSVPSLSSSSPAGVTPAPLSPTLQYAESIYARTLASPSARHSLPSHHSPLFTPHTHIPPIGPTTTPTPNAAPTSTLLRGRSILLPDMMTHAALQSTPTHPLQFAPQSPSSPPPAPFDSSSALPPHSPIPTRVGSAAVASPSSRPTHARAPSATPTVTAAIAAAAARITQPTHSVHVKSFSFGGGNGYAGLVSPLRVEPATTNPMTSPVLYGVSYPSLSSPSPPSHAPSVSRTHSSLSRMSGVRSAARSAVADLTAQLYTNNRRR